MTARDSGQIKFEDGTAKRGEVFIAEREVRAKCDIAGSESERTGSVFALSFFYKI